jgi:hypothetical protein
LTNAGVEGIDYYYPIEDNEYDKNNCYYLKRIVEKDSKNTWTENQIYYELININRNNFITGTYYVWDTLQHKLVLALTYDES